MWKRQNLKRFKNFNLLFLTVKKVNPKINLLFILLQLNSKDNTLAKKIVNKTFASRTNVIFGQNKYFAHSLQSSRSLSNKDPLLISQFVFIIRSMRSEALDVRFNLNKGDCQSITFAHLILPIGALRLRVAPGDEFTRCPQ